jgi:hypothetical protein
MVAFSPKGTTMAKSGAFRFDGGAATYVGTAILAWLVSFLTLGICFPFSVVLLTRWGAKHVTIDGRRLVFEGSAWSLFGNWIKWWFLMLITLGIYSFWVVPRLIRWAVEHTEFDPNTPTVTAPRPAMAAAAPAPLPQAPEPNLGSPDAMPVVPEPPADAVPPVSAMPAGWHPDPRGTHEMRWWDGAAWSSNVSDHGVTSTDG